MDMLGSIESSNVSPWPEVTPQTRELLTGLAELWPNAISGTPRALHELVTIILDTKLAQRDRLEKISTILGSDPSLGSVMIKLPNCEKFCITAAMLAIFRKRLDELQCYIQAGLSPNWADKKGYTLMHYAAMVDGPETFQWLKEVGGDPSIQNFVGGTAAGFFNAKNKDTSELCLYPWKIGPCVDRKFYKLAFGADYTRSSRFNSDSLLETRMHGTQTIETYSLSWTDELTRQYELMMSQPESSVPDVYLTEIGSADDGSDIPSALAKQYDVRARVPIPAGRVIIEYSGLVGREVKDHGFKRALIDKRAFGAASVDAEKVQNLASYINHGPPNCGFYPIMSNGLPRIVIVSLRDIGVDERLSMDYGPQYFLRGGIEPVELCPHAISKYLEITGNLSSFSAVQTKDGLQKLVINAIGQKSHETLEGTFHENSTDWTYHLAMLRYLMKDQKSLIALVKDRQIPESRLAAISDFLEESVTFR